MSELQEKLEAAQQQAIADLQAADDAKVVEEIRISMLGRKGLIPAAMQELGKLSKEEKPIIGKLANIVKKDITAAVAARLEELASGGQGENAIDVTLPGRRRRIGHKHLITKCIDDCCRIFRRMGFLVVQGPDIEDEYHNFDALNTPDDHPSRDLQDTFYLDMGKLLRTHTSPVQIRTMENQEPPVRVVCPGRCYRKDAPDATHTMNFSQIEGLYIDHGVSLADLKGTLLTFAREMFGDDVEIRLRPHFFPFTEPSVECDVLFRNFKGGKDQWLEIAGAGMVDPNVMKGVGYDAEEWTGFAFGMGIERIAMLKYNIADMRLMFENNVKFLHQF